MSKEDWLLVRSSKQFSVSLYRRIGTAIVVSLALNIALCVWALHQFFTRPAPAFYSTNGASPPMMLDALNAPNETSVPLLKSVSDKENDTKPVPQ
jgi:hypothetical protein